MSSARVPVMRMTTKFVVSVKEGAWNVHSDNVAVFVGVDGREGKERVLVDGRRGRFLFCDMLALRTAVGACPCLDLTISFFC